MCNKRAISTKDNSKHPVVFPTPTDRIWFFLIKVIFDSSATRVYLNLFLFWKNTD